MPTNMVRTSFQKPQPEGTPSVEGVFKGASACDHKLNKIISYMK